MRPRVTVRRLPAALRRSLQTQFGIASLREGQQRVIGAVLDGRDVLAVMPTGAGKSLCYQLPALHLEGTTVVVSPLIALMKDQVDKLADAGIAAEQLNSAQPKRAQDESMRRLEDALVFVTPERLTDPEFQAALKQQAIALLVIDEAHCISQWGHDFRPAYLEIGRALEVLGNPPVLGLTATATDAVIDDIRRELGRPDLEVVTTGLYRPNLRFQVVRCTRDDEKLDRLREALANAKGAGIVYTATVKNCIELHRRLTDDGESVSLYHGRLSSNDRREQQERFMRGETRVMIATGAFGMGIDKSDIRFVVHHQFPASLAAYYQEAGRAGRDGKPADCVLLHAHDDRRLQQFFLARRRPSIEALGQALDLLGTATEPATLDTLLAGHRPAVDRIELKAALAVLRNGRLAISDRSSRWRRLPSCAVSADTLARLLETHVRRSERDHEALERMVFYAQTGFCRWRVVLEAFDEPLPFESERCGHCDNCSTPPVEPAAAAAPATAAALPKKDARATFEPGQAVQVPRYGDGRVARSAGDEVEVVFPDGKRRSFVSSYVRAER